MIHARRQELKQLPGPAEWVGIHRPQTDDANQNMSYHPYAAIYGCSKCGANHARTLGDTDESCPLTPFDFKCEKCGQVETVALDGSQYPPVGYKYPQEGLVDGTWIVWWTYHGHGVWERTQELPVDPAAPPRTPTRDTAVFTDSDWQNMQSQATPGANNWVLDNHWSALDVGFGHTQQKTTSNVGD